MSRAGLVTAYAGFAGLSITVNIATQVLCIQAYEGRFAIPASIFLGTVTGLVTKYLLDKHYIFKHRSRSSSHEVKTFALYAVMGLATTVIFWSTEAVFHIFFTYDFMRYVGGVIGLSIGYVVKYMLDSRFVFSNSRPG